MYENKIIIIGNGSSVLDHELGDIIDSFGVVVRFNSFKINKFEKHVGTKTNIWFTVNKHHINNTKSFDRVIAHAWEWDKTKDRIYQDILKVFPECDKVTRDFVKNQIPCKTLPSTGLIAIFYLLMENPDLPIYLFGFDWWDRNIHHYGDNEKRGTLHNPKEEFEIISNLLKNQNVKFLSNE